MLVISMSEVYGMIQDNRRGCFSNCYHTVIVWNGFNAMYESDKTIG